MPTSARQTVHDAGDAHVMIRTKQHGAQRYRAADGGLIDRSKLCRFTFDGVPYTGFAGDTLASALLANGVRLLGRSFKYHRPRGLVATGAEEPNGMVALRSGARMEPNVRATQVELYDGLEANSQNRWPSLEFDIGAVNDKLSRFLPAGFYYKTFMWPQSWWMLYERVIRRAAGLGKAPSVPDPDRYGERHAYCDALVVGAGPAGLTAARVLGRSGLRVILIDDNPDVGGTLRHSDEQIDGKAAMEWVSAAKAELMDLDDVRVMSRACAFGYYDDNLIAAVERLAERTEAKPVAEAKPDNTAKLQQQLASTRSRMQQLNKALADAKLREVAIDLALISVVPSPSPPAPR